MAGHPPHTEGGKSPSRLPEAVGVGEVGVDAPSGRVGRVAGNLPALVLLLAGSRRQDGKEGSVHEPRFGWFKITN